MPNLEARQVLFAHGLVAWCKQADYLYYLMLAVPPIAFSLDQTDQTARALLDAWPQARLWLLEGALGAGKTTLVQAFCRVLGVQTDVASPTFSLAHTYHAGAQRVHHIDLYRLDSLQEAQDAGMLELIFSTDMCFVEWPSRLPDLLLEVAGPTTVSVLLDILPEGKRLAQISTIYAQA